MVGKACSKLITALPIPEQFYSKKAKLTICLPT
eukprot:CAMPEP_0203887402 /NCGR_PEP_ID=MMETSP0359-20131031/31114_1 /ASSEMBLY_ACC=CAM_ASM_000338 /TAXON_ID=268821 /ORGANISM="Scrippsiella Hangoei, Strain SHTV-5" /LENGTH=32 /DNA_ID= /DNA_START= /DNA_END= /DNA_ORIENTATION=